MQIFYGFETGLAYSVGAKAQGLANNGMTDEERAALDPSSQEYYLRSVRELKQKVETLQPAYFV